MTVRAKFIVESKQETYSGQGSTEPLVTIVLRPVITGSKENEEFFRHTPSGELKLGTLNKNAAEQFELGKAYYIDFTKAE